MMVLGKKVKAGLAVTAKLRRIGLPPPGPSPDLTPKEEKIHILWACLLACVEVVEGCLSRRETRQLCFCAIDSSVVIIIVDVVRKVQTSRVRIGLLNLANYFFGGIGVCRYDTMFDANGLCAGRIPKPRFVS
jgi:hypothetical protein